MNPLEKIERDMYAHLVGRQMFCPRTGAVLDVRTAVVVENPTGTSVLGIVSPEGWDEIKDGLLARMPDARIIIDGKVQT